MNYSSPSKKEGCAHIQKMGQHATYLTNVPMSELWENCPWCEIERLTAERDAANKLGQAECVMRHESYAERDRLTAALEAIRDGTDALACKYPQEYAGKVLAGAAVLHDDFKDLGSSPDETTPSRTCECEICSIPLVPQRGAAHYSGCPYSPLYEPPENGEGSR